MSDTRASNEWRDVRKTFSKRRFDPAFRLGSGDIRITIEDQIAIAYEIERLQKRVTALETFATELLLYFKSSNGVPVERAVIKADSSVVRTARAVEAQNDRPARL